MFNFGTRQMTLFGITREMRLTNTRHPAVDLLDFGEVRDDYWEQPDVQQNKSEATSEEETEEPSEEAGDAGLEDELLADLEAELREFPTCDIEESLSVEDREGEDEDRCSSTSHEFGIEVFTESGSENSDEEKEDVAENINVMVAGNEKSFSKSMRSKCGRAAREIRKAGEDEIRKRQHHPSSSRTHACGPAHFLWGKGGRSWRCSLGLAASA